MLAKYIFQKMYDHDEILKIMGGARTAVLSGDINVLVWNIFKGRKKGWKDDLLRLIQDKNLILLQEAITNSDHDWIFKREQSFEWVMARSYQNLITKKITGVKTGAITSSERQMFFSSPDTELFSNTPKMLLATTYPLSSGEQLLVLNMHTVNFVTLKKYSRQLNQIADAIGHHTGPIILGGDFNTWNGGRLAHFLEMMGAAGLQEVKFTRTGRWQHFNQHLDHIFYRGLTLKNAHILSDILTSDHYPLTAEFSV
jgi:endonuclease/exonuclease/phosphatase (EEP) superfamily protein YafD